MATCNCLTLLQGQLTVSLHPWCYPLLPPLPFGAPKLGTCLRLPHGLSSSIIFSVSSHDYLAPHSGLLMAMWLTLTHRPVLDL